MLVDVLVSACHRARPRRDVYSHSNEVPVVQVMLRIMLTGAGKVYMAT